MAYRVRAGKKHLKDTWNVSTFQDIESSLGDIMTAALSKIRYLADNQDYDTLNVTRAQLHPLWIEAQRAAKKSLFYHTSGLLAGSISKQLREQFMTHNETNIIAVGLGLTDKKYIEEKLHLIIGNIIKTQIKKEPEAFMQKNIRKGTESEINLR